jgi:DNA-binding SARP family transcriptional activator
MEFRILGPLEVLADGVPVQVSAPREQALLAVLLLEANRIVPVSRLIDAIWDGAPPETARNQIQICVSTLRRSLGRSGDHRVIRTRSPGYQVNVTGEIVDALRFEALTADARKAADDGNLRDAVSGLRAALGLWRGPAAAGIDSRVVQIAATRLNEKRLATIEACIGLELRMGNHAELIGELVTLVAEYPLREKLREYQMLALYRAGRRAEALAAYREARQVFVEELGIDPGHVLRRLEAAILRNDLSLDAAGTSPTAPPRLTTRRPQILCQLPPDIKDFTGRDDLIRQLRGVLTAEPPAAGSTPLGRVAVLTGAAGVGKTALAVHVAHELQDHFPDGQIFLQLGGSTRPFAADQLMTSALRALDVRPRALAPDDASDDAGDDARQGALYRTLLAPRRALIIMDDAGSARQVRALLPGGHHCTVIVTSRGRLPDLFGAPSFEVGMLPPAAAVELLTRGLGDAQPELAAVAELCGFWPLALRAISTQLLKHHHRTLREMITRLEHDQDRMAELRELFAADQDTMTAPVASA